MKRSFAYLVLTLLLSLLLSACGSTTENGKVTASPWPEATVPPMPTTTPFASASPSPDFSINNDTTGNDTETGDNAGSADNGLSGMTTSTPMPTDDNR